MNTTGKKYGGRTKGTPNKLSAEIKESLSLLISEAVSSLDINSMSKSEKLKLIQLGLPYVITKPQTEEVVEEQKFTVEIIDRLTDYSDKEILDLVLGNAEFTD